MILSERNRRITAIATLCLTLLGMIGAIFKFAYARPDRDEVRLMIKEETSPIMRELNLIHDDIREVKSGVKFVKDTMFDQ